MCSAPEVPKVKPPAPSPAPPLPAAQAPKSINSDASSVKRRPAGRNSLVVPLSNTGLNVPVG